MLFFASAVFIKNCLFQKFLSETLSECQTFFYPDQDRHSVGPDLGTNCFAKVINKKRVKYFSSMSNTLDK